MCFRTWLSDLYSLLLFIAIHSVLRKLKNIKFGASVDLLCKWLFQNLEAICIFTSLLVEPRREKTGLRGFRPGPTQTGLYKLRKELEA